jgi:N-acetylmuramoyl-L-alanine amidase
VSVIDTAREMPERHVLALTLHHEAAGEAARGMLAVGCVIRNRADWGKWGPTLRDVCLAPRQFSCWRPEGGQANHDALRAHAAALMEGRTPRALLPAFGVADRLLAECADITRGADHYYAPISMVPRGRVPAWAKGREPVAKIGRHLFFRLRPA